MNPIHDLGIDVIAALQSSSPWLAAPSRFFSFLGTDEFYLVILPFLYWCIDPRLGLRVGILLTVSDSLNTFFKFVFHQPRPYWVSDKVQALQAGRSYGLPSGHAQHALAVWGTIAAGGKPWLRWLMAVLIFLIGFSRIALAVHFPTDVLAGWLIGGLILWAFLKWEAAVMAWFNRFTLAQKIGLAFAASMLLLAIALIGLAFLPAADPVQWETDAARAFPPGPGSPAIRPRVTAGCFAVAGTFFGLVAGAILFFQQGGFDTGGARWRRSLRFVLGVIGLMILWYGLHNLFPRDPSLISQVLLYLRCALIGFWITCIAPWLFIKLGLQNVA